MRRFFTTAILIVGTSFCALTVHADELTATSWRLVKIQSMDDTTNIPDDTSKYTVAFDADGRVAIQADCNRGTGTWSSDAPSGLTFGPIASTRALCPPESLSEKYLEQFQWVRSFVMKDGHLFLATMADGAILEFEPAEKTMATVLGQPLGTTDAAELQSMILTQLFDQYAAERGITAERAEIDAFLDNLHSGKEAAGFTEQDDLTPEETAEVKVLETNMAAGLIRQWKINKALHEQFGGRIIYQQLGAEPLDAYRQFLEERQAEGAFSIEDTALSDAFWKYFRDESMHQFMAPGSADARNAFETPPWKNKP